MIDDIKDKNIKHQLYNFVYVDVACLYWKRMMFENYLYFFNRKLNCLWIEVLKKYCYYYYLSVENWSYYLID